MYYNIHPVQYLSIKSPHWRILSKIDKHYSVVLNSAPEVDKMEAKSFERKNGGATFYL